MQLSVVQELPPAAQWIRCRPLERCAVRLLASAIFQSTVWGRVLRVPSTSSRQHSSVVRASVLATKQKCAMAQKPHVTSIRSTQARMCAETPSMCATRRSTARDPV